MSVDTGGCAFVTGGSRGIGAAIARRLVGDGHLVAVGYRQDVRAAQDVVSSVPRGRAFAIRCDVTSQPDVDKTFQELNEQHGGVTVLVNNAGVHRDGLAIGLTDDDWNDVIDLNLTAAFRTSRVAARAMARARSGRIINVTSILAHSGLPGASNYAAAKAGLGGFTRALALELAPRGVTVNAVAPGLIRTDLTADVTHFDRSCRREVPMRRPGTVNEVAACVSFLAGDDATYVTGQTLTVDGGLTAAAFNIAPSEGE